jgi:hypothetical protein
MRIRSLLLCSDEARLDVFPDVGRRLGRIDDAQNAALLIVAEERRRHRMVGLKARLERVGVVVVAVHERLASDVVLAGHLGRRKLDVIRATARLVNQTASDAAHQQRVVDAQLDDRVEFLFLRLKLEK